MTQTINENDDDKKLSNLSEKNENIKKLQEIYADSYSKNQNLKKDSIKRNERINTIENEVNSWKNLLINSEIKINELNERKKTFNQKLEELDKQPQTQAEKKGQISESLRISENEKKENEILIDQIDNQISDFRNELNVTKESSIEIRERKASSSATIEGLDKRRNDLLDRIDTDLNLNEENLLSFSNLEKQDEFPDAVTQEELLDAKKRERENNFSKSIHTDIETNQIGVFSLSLFLHIRDREVEI